MPNVPRALAVALLTSAMLTPAAAQQINRWTPPMTAGTPQPKTGYSPCATRECEYRIVSTSAFERRMDGKLTPVLSVRVAVHNLTARRLLSSAQQFHFGLSDRAIREGAGATPVVAARGPMMSAAGELSPSDVEIPSGAEVLLDYHLLDLGPNKIVLNLLHGEQVKASGMETGMACPYYALEQRMLNEGRLGYDVAASPPRICGQGASRPAPTAPTSGPTSPVRAGLERWVGAWESHGDWLSFSLQNGRLVPTIYSHADTISTSEELQLDEARSTPVRLHGTFDHEGKFFPVALNYGADGNYLTMLFAAPASEGKVESEFARHYRRVRAVGEEARRPTLSTQLQRLAGQWQTPVGIMTITPQGTNLTGTLKLASGEVIQLKNAWESSTEGRADVDELSIDFVTPTSYETGGTEMHLYPSPDGRMLQVNVAKPIGEYRSFVATRPAASSPTAPTQPPPTPPVATPPGGGQPPATDEDSTYAGGWGNGSGGGSVGSSPGGGGASAPSGGTASSVSGAGGYVSVSKVFDVMFESAKVSRGGELHVFVSIKNMANHDAPITPGNFIPKVKNADGEWIVSRELFRASGEVPTSFRPIIPPGETVRVRFVFRPDAKTAQLRTFSLGVFEGQTHEWDVSGARLASLAQ
jgi:hypothetical protein